MAADINPEGMPVFEYTSPAPAVSVPHLVQWWQASLQRQRSLTPHQHLQCLPYQLHSQSAVPVRYAAPTLTVTGINLNKVDIPDVLQQSQVGLPLHRGMFHGILRGHTESVRCLHREHCTLEPSGGMRVHLREGLVNIVHRAPPFSNFWFGRLVYEGRAGRPADEFRTIACPDTDAMFEAIAKHKLQDSFIAPSADLEMVFPVKQLMLVQASAWCCALGFVRERRSRSADSTCLFRCVENSWKALIHPVLISSLGIALLS